MDLPLFLLNKLVNEYLSMHLYSARMNAKNQSCHSTEKLNQVNTESQL